MAFITKHQKRRLFVSAVTAVAMTGAAMAPVSAADDGPQDDLKPVAAKPASANKTPAKGSAKTQVVYDRFGNPIELKEPLVTVARASSDDGISAVMEDYGLEGWRGDLPTFGSSLDALAMGFSVDELIEGADLNINTGERRQAVRQDSGLAFSSRGVTRSFNAGGNRVLGWNRGLGFNRGFGGGIVFNPRDFSVAARSANRTINRAMNRGRFELGGTGFYGSRFAGRW